MQGTSRLKRVPKVKYFMKNNNLIVSIKYISYS